MNPVKITSASCQSSSSIPVPTSSMVNSAETRLSRPSANRSAMESMSETWREMTRPEVYFSWKATGSRWKCANRRQRSSSTTLPPSRPMPLM